MIPLGQFRDTFIIAIDDEGMAIIDQHVAHERVLFERVMERLTAGRSSRSACWCRCSWSWRRPRTRRSSAAPAELERLGFEVEAFGDERRQRDRRAGAAEDGGEREGAAGAGRRPRGARSRRACAGGAAADCRDDGLPRRGEGELSASYEKMMHILDELRATAYSTVCPHGRPVMLRLTRREIEKNFERI